MADPSQSETPITRPDYMVAVMEAMDEMDSHDTSLTERVRSAAGSTWQRIGQLSLREKLRFRIDQDEEDPILGEVIDVGDEESTVLLDGDEEPTRVETTRLHATKDFVMLKNNEGKVAATVISVSLAGLYVWQRARK